jgi:hypothetical protein
MRKITGRKRGEEGPVHRLLENIQVTEPLKKSNELK